MEYFKYGMMWTTVLPFHCQFASVAEWQSERHSLAINSRLPTPESLNFTVWFCHVIHNSSSIYDLQRVEFIQFQMAFLHEASTQGAEFTKPRLSAWH